MWRGIAASVLWIGATVAPLMAPAAALLVAPAAAGESVDIELVLLADASRSIDDGELRFQREGYAIAITHADVSPSDGKAGGGGATGGGTVASGRNCCGAPSCSLTDDWLGTLTISETIGRPGSVAV